MEFFQRYYPVVLALVSLLMSVYLWFSGQREEGLFVGIWVPSILAFGIYIEMVKNRGPK